MQIRNIPRNVPRYTRKFRMYRANSSPYLSGDLFADKADISLYGPRFRGSKPSIKEVSTAKVIFCPSHMYESMIRDYGKAISAKVIILGNSDRDFDNHEMDIPESVTRVFLQNSTIINPRFRCIPIGLENIRIAVNGLPKFFNENLVSQDKNGRMLIGPFGNTHAEREMLSHLRPGKYENFDVFAGRWSPLEFSKISSKYSLIAAPRGNGLDTHRFWEALYRGSIPVVRGTAWSQDMLKIGIPCVEIPDWSIDNLYRVAQFQTEKIYPERIPALWWPYWKSQIAEALGET
jgi:hypothetical protein